MNSLTALVTLSVVSTSALVALTPANAQSADLPEGPGKALVQESCTTCHGADLVTAQRRSPDEWTEVVNRMVGNGAQLTEEQNKAVLAYLGTYLGKGAPTGAAGSSAADASHAGAHH